MRKICLTKLCQIRIKKSQRCFNIQYTKYFSIRTCRRNDNVIFYGDFLSFRECVEEAVRRGVNLLNADLRFSDLRGANLQRASLDWASFTGANLSGANLSYSSLTFSGGCKVQASLCNFRYANLKEALLTDSDLRRADFQDANAGNVSFRGSDLRGAKIFNTLLVNACFADALVLEDMTAFLTAHKKKVVNIYEERK